MNACSLVHVLKQYINSTVSCLCVSLSPCTATKLYNYVCTYNMQYIRVLYSINCMCMNMHVDLAEHSKCMEAECLMMLVKC